MPLDLMPLGLAPQPPPLSGTRQVDGGQMPGPGTGGRSAGDGLLSPAVKGSQINGINLGQISPWAPFTFKAHSYVHVISKFTLLNFIGQNCGILDFLAK
jgi:hypothetical protein